jgi:hypothetical protein
LLLSTICTVYHPEPKSVGTGQVNVPEFLMPPAIKVSLRLSIGTNGLLAISVPDERLLVDPNRRVRVIGPGVDGVHVMVRLCPARMFWPKAGVRIGLAASATAAPIAAATVKRTPKRRIARYFGWDVSWT